MNALFNLAILKMNKSAQSIGTVGDKPIEITNALTLSSDAQSYLQAAKILNKKSIKELSKPIYFLTLRSIELLFKSIMKLKEGISTQELKDLYGHNLAKLMDRCIEKKYVVISKESMKMIKAISKYYDDKHFEYTRLEDMSLYHSNYYISIAEKITKQISKICNEIGTLRYI